jgi:hypothetical protein
MPYFPILGQRSDEVTFKDLMEGTGKNKAGYDKIRFCAKQAASDSLQYFWVDTCCIDKSSSAELTEAINSMFRWYRDATKCYVYLSDVPAREHDVSDHNSPLAWEVSLMRSRWFTRGWTLQELIAPASVEFFSRQGDLLGSKMSLERHIHERTGIAAEALRGNPLSYFTAKERMSWAAGRQTKREEDGAYSLLGIFDIHMSLIYGEGRKNAFNRLWEKIDKSSRGLTTQNIDLAKLPTANGASFDSHSDEHTARCLADTRVELKRQIKKWVDDPQGKSIFWLNGMAGTGKSTIARTIAYTFAADGHLGASFFFKKGEGDRSNASKFFTTIATQLMVHLPELIPWIRRAIEADPTISEKILKEQFEKLILQPLSQICQISSQPPRVVIVIDALDECEREEDIRAILRLLARAKDEGTVFRIFVTSRPELPIRLGFTEMAAGTYQDLILHEVPRVTIEHDLSVFFEHELAKIREERSLPLDWPGSTRLRALVNIATPLFIFAATVCRFVGETRGNPKRRLDTILDYQAVNQVSELDRTYLPILDQLFDDQDEVERGRLAEEFREVVGIVVVLESPLSSVSLASLLSIPKEDVICRLDSLHSVLNIPTNEYTPIRLLHLSFRDFLLDPKKRGKSPFWIDERDTHKRLATKCLQLMSRSGCLRKDICNLKKPGTLRKEINSQIIDICLPAEVQYACRFWVSHLEQSKSCIYDHGQVHVFLREHWLHWLEAMSPFREYDREHYHDYNLTVHFRCRPSLRYSRKS